MLVGLFFGGGGEDAEVNFCGGLHEKSAVVGWVSGTNSAFALGPRINPRNTVFELQVVGLHVGFRLYESKDAVRTSQRTYCVIP